MKAIHVGCGAISHSWAEAYRKIPEIKIIGYVDIDLERARHFAHQYSPGAEVFTDYATAIQKTSPDIVIEAVIPSERRNLVLKAFELGCDVISAKPLAQNLEEAAELVRGAKNQRRLHAVVQNLRYDLGARRLQEFLNSGAIGRVVEVHCDFFIGAHFDGFRTSIEHVLLHDMAVHSFDLARLFCHENPISVFCHSHNPENSWFSHGAAAAAIFELPSGGIITYRGSWCAEGLRTPWTSNWRIIGTKGSVIWEGDTFKAEVATGEVDELLAELSAVEVPEFTSQKGIGGAEGVFRDFLEALETKTDPETASSDNFLSFAMATAAIESANLGQKVPVATAVN